MNWYNPNRVNQYTHQHNHRNNGYHHNNNHYQHHQYHQHHQHHQPQYNNNNHSNHYNHGPHYPQQRNQQYQHQYHDQANFSINTNSINSNHHSNYHNYHNYPQHNNQHRIHPRTHSNVRKQKHHQVISTKTETFLFTKKVRTPPIFYDPQTEIARRVNRIPRKYEDTMFEEEEKQRLLHLERCDVIRQHQLNHREDCDSENNNPITPSASDNSDNDEYVDNDTQINDKRIDFGSMKNNKIRNIWEATGDYAMIDENGRNLLDNDEDDTEQYGIYNANGIRQQAMMVPDVPTIDGEYIAANAKCVGKKKSKKKQEIEQHRKKKKTRRGGKGKGKMNKKVLTQQEIAEMEARELVAYLELSRKTVY